jgi:hypothetical protein
MSCDWAAFNAADRLGRGAADGTAVLVVEVDGDGLVGDVDCADLPGVDPGLPHIRAGKRRVRDDLLAAPFLLVGSDDEILTAVRQHQQRWGVSRLVIREDASGKLVPLLPRLGETTA